MDFKEKVYQQCLLVINEKVHALQTALNDIKESIRNETKSTVGDKHETARAHLQIEQENKGRQLKEIADQKAILEQIDIRISSPAVIKGSLLKTSKGYLFISVATGKLIIDGITVFALSPQSPLGAKLMGLQPGATTRMNDAVYLIEEIS